MSKRSMNLSMLELYFRHRIYSSYFAMQCYLKHEVHGMPLTSVRERPAGAGRSHNCGVAAALAFSVRYSS